MSVNKDGTTFVVGAPSKGGVGNGIRNGHVSVYQFNATSNRYTQVGPDIVGAADRTGTSLSISADGKTFVVGSPDYNTGTGRVAVYQLNSTIHEYIQFGLSLYGEAERDSFGMAVSISADGNTFVVGARNNNGNGSNSGHVRVYQLNSTMNTYTQMGSDIDGEGENDAFGAAVSISGNGAIFVVGAPFNSGKSTYAGHVRVYQWNSLANRYIQLGSDIDGVEFGYNFGQSVSISEDATIFVVGGTLNYPYGNETLSNSGYVSVYQFDSTLNMYTKIGSDINGERQNDSFGNPVSISADGKIFLAGASGNNGNGTNSGHTRIYQFNADTNSYSQLGTDIDGEAPGDTFSGMSVSLSSDGSTFVVGANANDGNGLNAGHVRVYKSPSMTPTKGPTKPPTKSPMTPTKAPVVPVPTTIQTKIPVLVAPIIAPARVRPRCGFFRRLFRICK